MLAVFLLGMTALYAFTTPRMRIFWTIIIALLITVAEGFVAASASKCPQMCSCYINKFIHLLEIDCTGHQMNEQRLGTLLLENNLEETLRLLYLTRTTMTQIPWSVCQLSTLWSLKVNDNRLTGFDNTCFTNMTSLTHIYAERNLITKLHDGVFDGLKSLEYLDLGGNRISDNGLHVFSNRYNLRNLQFIDLRDNLLTSLQNGVFDGLNALNHLNLSGNRISDIGLQVFSYRSDLWNLQIIDLRGNLLTSLQNRVFDGLRALKYLYLRGNRISDIGLHVFSGRDDLRNLDLRDNLLTSLQDRVFDGLSALKYLYLSGNRISDIGVHVFSNPSNLLLLWNIDLSNNSLTSLEPWPIILGKRQHGSSNSRVHINVSNNFIYKFTNKIGLQFKPNEESSHLELDISENNIQHLNDILVGWNLTHLSPSVFVDDTFRIVVSSSGQYNCDCKDIEFYKEIHNLDSSFHVSVAGLQCFTPSLSVAGLQCFTPSRLANKAVTQVPLEEFVCELEDHCPPSCRCAYCPANDILHVNCSAANMSSLPLDLPPLPNSNVRYKLDFSNNKFLQRLDHRPFFVNTSILDISNCALDNIDLNIWQELLTNIQSVYLHGNKLTHFPWEISRVNVTSTSLTLNNNPWECSCSNQWIIAWMKSLSSVLTNSVDVVCATPSRLRNLSILNSGENGFCVDPVMRMLKISLSSTLSAMALLLLSGFALYRLRVRLYRRWKFHPFDRDECVGEEMDYDVFLCCSSEDSQDGLRILELMEFNGFSVCYHERDFLPGELITDNMTHGVMRSKRTVCLISGNFLRR